MPIIDAHCDYCGHELQDVFVATHPATGEPVDQRLFCPTCQQEHDQWTKTGSGAAANMAATWARQCRGS